MNDEVEMKEEELKETDNYLQQGYDMAYNVPFLSRVIGFLAGIASIVTEFIGVAFRNIVLGKGDSMNLQNAFENGYRAAIGKQKKRDREEKQDSQKKDAPETTPEEKKEEHEKAKQKEINQDTHILLDSKEVKSAFDRLGLIPVPDDKSNQILLFSKDDPDLSKVYSISKTSFIYGKGNDLADALIQLNEKSDDSINIKCAASAAFTYAATCAVGYRQTLIDDFNNRKETILSEASVKTAAGNATVQIKSNTSYPGTFDVYYNNELILDNIKYDKLMGNDKTLDSISQLIEQKHFATLKEEHSVVRMSSYFIENEKLSFSRNDDGTVTVNWSSLNDPNNKTEMGTYFVNETKDLERLKNDFEKEFDHKELTGDGDATVNCKTFNMAVEREESVFEQVNVSAAEMAYAIGVTANPSIRESVDEHGKVFNITNGEYEDPGNAHIEIAHSKDGVTVQKCIPAIDKNNILHMETKELYFYQNNISFEDCLISLHDAFSEIKNCNLSMEDYDRSQNVEKIIETENEAYEANYVEKDEAMHILEESAKSLNEDAQKIIDQYTMEDRETDTPSQERSAEEQEL